MSFPSAFLITQPEAAKAALLRYSAVYEMYSSDPADAPKLTVVKAVPVAQLNSSLNPAIREIINKTVSADELPAEAKSKIQSLQANPNPMAKQLVGDESSICEHCLSHPYVTGYQPFPGGWKNHHCGEPGLCFRPGRTEGGGGRFRSSQTALA